MLGARVERFIYTATSGIISPRLASVDGLVPISTKNPTAEHCCVFGRKSGIGASIQATTNLTITQGPPSEEVPSSLTKIVSTVFNQWLSLPQALSTY